MMFHGIPWNSTEAYGQEEDLFLVQENNLPAREEDLLLAQAQTRDEKATNNQ